ncbi:hypothetical protein JD79_02692 [Geodermatophilus normandii]|uniref:Uncharacterized protein n=1 Tax=Geodermatophilus normandii TaxID=1137989 RepID=A0A317QIL3_9ACTN|nr:hypothetical protein JD79_02692 [Geodermatophilus normandii]
MLNANNESPKTRSYVVLYLADLLPRVGADRLERAARILETLPSMAGKIGLARQSQWKKYPSLYLADIAGKPTEERVLFDALNELTADV